MVVEIQFGRFLGENSTLGSHITVRLLFYITGDYNRIVDTICVPEILVPEYNKLFTFYLNDR